MKAELFALRDVGLTNQVCPNLHFARSANQPYDVCGRRHNPPIEILRISVRPRCVIPHCREHRRRLTGVGKHDRVLLEKAESQQRLSMLFPTFQPALIDELHELGRPFLKPLLQRTRVSLRAISVHMILDCVRAPVHKHINETASQQNPENSDDNTLPHTLVIGGILRSLCSFAAISFSLTPDFLHS